jgi:DNA integrity scanning protein DisA with diadenylate cyclase activity
LFQLVSRKIDISFHPKKLQEVAKMNKKLVLLALPVLAIIAVTGVVSAFPFWNNTNAKSGWNEWEIANMTEEHKEFKVQLLELRQDMIQNQIAYLKGEITEKQYKGSLQQLFDEMKSLHEQMRNNADGEGLAGCGFMNGMKGKGFGRGMKRGRGF